VEVHVETVQILGENDSAVRFHTYRYIPQTLTICDRQIHYKRSIKLLNSYGQYRIFELDYRRMLFYFDYDLN